MTRLLIVQVSGLEVLERGGARLAVADRLVAEGRLGALRLPRAPDDGEVALALLGYGPRDHRAGGGALLAAAAGVELAPDEVAWRLDLVTTLDGRTTAPAPNLVSTSEARVLVEDLRHALSDEPLRVEHGAGASALLVQHATSEDPRGLGWRAPAAGVALEDIVPAAADSALRAFVVAAHERLRSHDVNRVRVDLGEDPVDGVWPWAPGFASELEPFRLRTGLSLAVFGQDPAVLGAARLAGVAPLGAAPVSTQASARRAACASVAAALDTHDVVLVQLAVPDGASRSAATALDAWLAAILEPARAGGACVVLTAGARAPTIHPSGAVPVVLAGPGVSPGRGTSFSAAEAAVGTFMVEESHALLGFVQGVTRDAAPPRAPSASSEETPS